MQRKIEIDKMDRMEFMRMIEKLVTAFICRPITIQKVIQILISRKKNELECEEQEVNRSSMQNTENGIHSVPDQTPTTFPSHLNPSSNSNTSQPKQLCHANKCCLLRVKGFLRRPMFCAYKKYVLWLHK